MKRLILLILTLTCCGFAHSAEDLSHITDAGGTVFGAWDFENGYELTHSGGGSISRLGGNVTKPEGTGCSNTDDYHNTIISNDSAGQLAVSGSDYALKTPYSGNCPDESFSRDTTILHPGSSESELYVRWYQKWTGDWDSGSVQQKFTKFYDTSSPVDSKLMHFSFAPYSEVWRNWMPNVDGQFDRTNPPQGSWVWVYETEDQASGAYTNSRRSWDDINNEQGPGSTDQKTTFNPGEWYCLELYFKENSSSSVADGAAKAWVNGELVFSVENIKFWPTGSKTSAMGVNTLELQHIYYNRTSNDQPTYMDNIVIADRYVGPIGAAATTHTLTITKVETSGSGTVVSAPSGIDCGSTCADDFNENTDVQLSKTGDDVVWSGDCNSSGLVSMGTADKACTATFTAPTQHTLTVTKVETSGTGTVTSAPSGIDCGSTCADDFDENSSVQLSKSGDNVVWSGDCDSSGLVDIGTGSKACTATFTNVGVSCDASHYYSCTTESPCTSAGFYWWEDACRTVVEPKDWTGGNIIDNGDFASWGATMPYSYATFDNESGITEDEYGCNITTLDNDNHMHVYQSFPEVKTYRYVFNIVEISDNFELYTLAEDSTFFTTTGTKTGVISYVSGDDRIYFQTPSGAVDNAIINDIVIKEYAPVTSTAGGSYTIH